MYCLAIITFRQFIKWNKQRQSINFTHWFWKQQT